MLSLKQNVHIGIVDNIKREVTLSENYLKELTTKLSTAEEKIESFSKTLGSGMKLDFNIDEASISKVTDSLVSLEAELKSIKDVISSTDFNIGLNFDFGGKSNSIQRSNAYKAEMKKIITELRQQALSLEEEVNNTLGRTNGNYLDSLFTLFGNSFKLQI